MRLKEIDIKSEVKALKRNLTSCAVKTRFKKNRFSHIATKHKTMNFKYSNRYHR